MSSLSSSAPAPSADPEESIRHLSETARAGYREFRATGRIEALDPLILAILADFMPRKNARPLQDLPGETKLMEDLGFDSLAITEVVFFTEDLFGISIANEEIIQVRTLDDLRSFIRAKVAGRNGG
jgi:acyl carrier protein